MHKDSHFSLKEITKIEGHTNLDIELRDGKAEKCELGIFEGQRFFEQMVVGKHYSQVPLITARICGLCNVSHLSTAIEAVERAFGVKASEQTMALRELATHGEFIKSHALHLVFLALPDFLGKETALDFTGEEHRYIHWGLDLKKAGTDIVRLLGGRAYQTVSIRPGGFTALPKQGSLEALLPQLEEARKLSVELLGIFGGLKEKFPFERETEYAAIVGPKYSFIEGEIQCTDGTRVPKENALSHVKEFAVPYSAAKHALFNGKSFKVGSQSRMNLNQNELHGSAKKAMSDLKIKFPSHKAYYNNLAQAIELLHCIESSIDIISGIKIRKESMAEIKPREASGLGVTEAPRGTLYHQYSFDANGYIKGANLVIPTLQNNHNIEEDIKALIPEIIGLPQEKAELEIEKLVRSYDPCISCATHFLKVNWAKK